MQKLSREQIAEMDFKAAEDYIRNWRDSHVPHWRRFLVVGYNLLFGGGCYYLTVNFRKFAPKVQAANRTIPQIVKKGTLISTSVLTAYFLGLYLAVGLRHPLQFFLDYTEMQSHLYSRSLRFVPRVQEYLLFNTMRQFGLAEELVTRAREQLEQEKAQLMAQGRLSLQELEEGERRGESPQPGEPLGLTLKGRKL